MIFFEFILYLFRFFKLKISSFFRALIWQLTRQVNDVSPRDDVYTCHMAHTCEYLCVCGYACVSVIVRASLTSGLSILFMI